MNRFTFAVLVLLISFGTPIVLHNVIGIEPIVFDNIEEESLLVEEVNVEEVQLASSHPFTDLSGHWGEDYIQELYTRGVVSGYSDGTFRPDDEVNRAEALKIIMDAFAYPLNVYSFDPYPFDDVDEDDWFREYVDEALANGIVSSDNTSFNPSDEITRAEGLKITLEAGGQTVSNSVTPNFNDVDPYSDWFATYTAYAKNHGIATGDSSGNYRPSDEMTRAELSKTVMESIYFIEGQSN